MERVEGRVLGNPNRLSSLRSVITSHSVFAASQKEDGE